jgi:hypothetical protein
MIKNLLGAICSFAFLLFSVSNGSRLFLFLLRRKKVVSYFLMPYLLVKFLKLKTPKKASVSYLMGSVSDILKSRGMENGKSL